MRKNEVGQNMKIVYVPRTYSPNYYKNRFYFENRIFQETKNNALKALNNFRRKYVFSPIEGFFEESLFKAANVRRVRLANFNFGLRDQHDAIVLHFRSVPGRLMGEPEELMRLVDGFSGIRILFIDDDRAETMMPDNIIDSFDLVIKREPYIDRDRYDLSSKNRRKIKATMLACPHNVHSQYSFLRRQKFKDFFEDAKCEKTSDLFFLGKATASRLEIWKALNQIDGIRLAGGLLPRVGFELGAEYAAESLSPKDFIKALKTAKVGLAVDGHGEFTFRHLETWLSGTLLMAHSKIREIEIPIPMEEEKHFLCYSNASELAEKIQSCIDNPNKSNSIALDGRDIFKKYYSTDVHASHILNWLEG